MTSIEPDQYPKSQSSLPAVNGWLVVALLVCGAILVYRIMNPGPLLPFDPNARPRNVVARGDLAEDEKSSIELFKRASPTVVHITTSDLSIMRDQFRMNLQEIPKGSGTGIIWNEDGYIVTNYHVIHGAERATVTLWNNTAFDAILVGTDPSSDLAVLRIDPSKAQLTPIDLGTSSDLQVGQKVFAIGSPFGLDQTLTTGIISGLGREIQTFNNQTVAGAIQTDAAINPGNSGGPLLDSSGLMIGMNTAIVSRSGSSSGVGFAVPVDRINRIVPELIRHGHVQRPGMGILPLEDAVTQRLRAVGVIPNDRFGILIQAVVPNSAAEDAGLKATQFSPEERRVILGDMILEIDGEKTASLSDLFKVLAKKSVGETISIKVLRKDAVVEVPLKLQAIPSFE